MNVEGDAVGKEREKCKFKKKKIYHLFLHKIDFESLVSIKLALKDLDI